MTSGHQQMFTWNWRFELSLKLNLVWISVFFFSSVPLCQVSFPRHCREVWSSGWYAPSCSFSQREQVWLPTLPLPTLQSHLLRLGAHSLLQQFVKQAHLLSCIIWKTIWNLRLCHKGLMEANSVREWMHVLDRRTLKKILCWLKSNNSG